MADHMNYISYLVRTKFFCNSTLTSILASVIIYSAYRLIGNIGCMYLECLTFVIICLCMYIERDIVSSIVLKGERCRMTQ